MTQDDFHRIAREAGFAYDTHRGQVCASHGNKSWVITQELEQFSKLVQKQQHKEFRALALEISQDIIGKAKDEERDRICKIVYGMCISDNNAFEIVQAIKAVTAKGASNHDNQGNDSTG